MVDVHPWMKIKVVKDEPRLEDAILVTDQLRQRRSVE
jgi:hypothetical protein